MRISGTDHSSVILNPTVTLVKTCYGIIGASRKVHVIKNSETAFSKSNVNYFRSIKNSFEVIENLRLRNFQGSQVSSFDFPSLYTYLPHDFYQGKSVVSC